MANRISVKELSELLAKEVQSGNGDAFIFVGEYYITKDNYTEEIVANYDRITGIMDNTTKVHELPYIIYKDDFTKEKIMAINYHHVQKLTDEENAELERQLKAEEEKKMLKSSKKSAAPRYGAINVEPVYVNYGNYRVDRYAVQEDMVAAPAVAPVDNGNDAEAPQVQEQAPIAQDDPGHDHAVRQNENPDRRNELRDYINQLEQDYLRRR